MYINEEIALQMAKQRIEEAVRAVEQRRAIGFERADHSARVRLGRVLVRLGQWMVGHA